MLVSLINEGVVAFLRVFGGLTGFRDDSCAQDVVVDAGYVVVYIACVLTARYTDVVCWMDAQGV